MELFSIPQQHEQIIHVGKMKIVPKYKIMFLLTINFIKYHYE